ncbi:endo alpha-1,4 polygalactosaminidase [Myceligenerans cantabricum]
MSRTSLALITVLALTGCSPAGAATTAETAARSTAETPVETGTPAALPPTGGSFDYQLGAAYVPDGGLDVVVRDATADPLPGAYNVCYVNGFQTQPGEADLWTGRNEDLLLHDADGRLVIDPDWPDEFVLDPSTQQRRDGIVAVLGPVITGCADDGFDAVEIDNLDTFTRYDDPATGLVERAGALALAAAYAEVAHEAGLAVAQKNTAELEGDGAGLGFDFAVAEECGAVSADARDEDPGTDYSECGVYREAYGDHVLQVEYTDHLPVPFDALCDDPDRAPLTVLRDRDLVGPGDPDHALERCAAGS